MGQAEVYEGGSILLEKLLRIEVNSKQLERLSKHYGGVLAEELAEESVEDLPESLADDEQMYMMMDGSMIYSRLGEWKEVKLGRLFSSKHRWDAGKNRHCIGDSMYVGHIGSCRSFFEKLSVYTDRYEKDLVFIGDGASWIWNWVEAHYPNATQILDYYHAAQHLGEFASLVFSEEEAKQCWLEAQKNYLWEDRVDTVLEEIAAQECRTKQQKEKQRSLVNYYQNNRHRMRYKTFTEQKLLVGSGAIEAAHRTVIQKRLKCSGQRWTIEGAQKVLNLRVANMSGYWGKVIKLIDGQMAV